MTEQLLGSGSHHKHMSYREIKQLQQQMKKNYAKVSHIQKKADEVMKKEAEQADQELLKHLEQ